MGLHREAILLYYKIEKKDMAGYALCITMLKTEAFPCLRCSLSREE